MSVNTKTVANRREVTYTSYDDLLAEAEQFAAGEVATIGNWSFPQILKHLGVSFNGSIDGIPFKAPWAMKVMANLFMRKKFLTKTLPSGFKIPKNAGFVFLPKDSTLTEEGLAELRKAIERCKSESNRAIHPVFGEFTREEWDKFNLRHAELHMSFVKAKSG